MGVFDPGFVTPERRRLRRKAFEGGIHAIESLPEKREQLVKEGWSWWKELAPLNSLEREKVWRDVREFALALLEQQKPGEAPVEEARAS